MGTARSGLGYFLPVKQVIDSWVFSCLVGAVGFDHLLIVLGRKGEEQGDGIGPQLAGLNHTRLLLRQPMKHLFPVPPQPPLEPFLALFRGEHRVVRACPRAMSQLGRSYPQGRSPSVMLRAAPPGYSITDAGLIVSDTTPVPANRIRTGFEQAHKEINKILQQFANSLADGFTIKEIELSASFNAEGKFLGFGVGGAATVTVRIGPED